MENSSIKKELLLHPLKKSSTSQWLGGYPPVDGDWCVNSSIIGLNQYAIINGDITISGGCSLTLYNTTLIMNSSYPTINKIEVLSGGGLFIYDNDNNSATREDASNISLMYPTSGAVDFHVSKGASIIIRNSDIYGIGEYNFKGITIECDNAIIENNHFSRNKGGIFLINSTNSIIANNSFRNTTYYSTISIQKGSNNTVINNYDKFGTGGVSIGYSENNIVVNNNFTSYYGGIGINLAMAVKSNIIKNNNIQGMFTGISIYQSDYIGTNIIANNRLISNLAQVRAFKDSGGSKIILQNNTFIDTGSFAFEIHDSAEIISINTTFSQDDRIYLPESAGVLIIKNYLNVRVAGSDYISPVSGADVEILDDITPVYKTPGYGGSDGKTSSEGIIKWVLVTDRVYNDSEIPTDVVTTVKVKFNAWEYIDNNVNMAQSHVETYSVGQTVFESTNIMDTIIATSCLSVFFIMCVRRVRKKYH